MFNNYLDVALRSFLGNKLFSFINLFDVFEFEWLAGDPETALGSPSGMVITESVARKYFGDAPALGQTLKLENTVDFTVTGVIADLPGNTHLRGRIFMPIQSFLALMGELASNSWGWNSTHTYVRLAPGADIAALESAFPEFPISRRFVDDSFDALYQDDTRLGQMFSSFAVLAILVACLGLFGLATFNAQRRTKEIGVRKVMGGSVWSIVLLLTNDFSKLVLISNLVAWPVAYFTMARWLENFAYRIDLTPLVFIGSGLIALCIAWVTVGGTAAKAASRKPVLALRYE